MRRIKTDVAIIGGGAAGCYAALSLHEQGIAPLIVCKGLVGKSGASLFAGNLVDLRQAAWQHRRASAQHRRIPDQVSQPISDRSALGAALRRMDRERLLSGARGSGPLFPARRRRQRGHQPGQDPQRRGERAGQFRRAVHGPAAQADHQSRHPAARGNRRRLRCCATPTAQCAASSASTC